MLETGSILQSDAGSITVKILQFLSKGSQAEVYEVEIKEKEKEEGRFALKYYFEEHCKDQKFKDNLRSVIEKKKPTNRFIWPLRFVENGNRFGYLMSLLPSEYQALSSCFSGKLKINDNIKFKFCINMCDAFHDLHSLGYNHKDISPKNIYINPDDGNILIIDNDNITPNRETSASKKIIKGTPGYMAPELYDDPKKVPTRQTDLYSIGVLIFKLLFQNTDPFESSVSTDFQSSSTSSDNPKNKKFIFHETIGNDESNTESDQTKLWFSYPESLRDLFKRLFTEGISDPWKRPDCAEWRDALIKCRAAAYSCPNPNCSFSSFLNENELMKNNGKMHCLLCNKDFTLPIMKSGKDTLVVMNDKKELYSGYFEDLKQNESRTETVMTAELTKKGLRLLNKSNYSVTHRGKTIKKEEYTDFIKDLDSLTIDGKTYKIVEMRIK